MLQEAPALLLQIQKQKELKRCFDLFCITREKILSKFEISKQTKKHNSQSNKISHIRAVTKWSKAGVHSVHYYLNNTIKKKKVKLNMFEELFTRNTLLFFFFIEWSSLELHLIPLLDADILPRYKSVLISITQN